MYDIRVSETDGRGLYAAHPIIPGEIIMICELLVLSEDDSIKVGYTELKHYIFKYNQDQDCLVLGDAELFNHSNESNVSYELEAVEGRKVMVFTAKRFIESGEQLFIDYRADDKTIDTVEYCESKSLIG